ncbi:tryptophan synthase subunit beta [Planctomycetota bacterium]|nr:tryptophan synthase subunit beta [Planctomycetota bacterium]
MNTDTEKQSKLSHLPSDSGHYGDFGGIFVPETLHVALKQLTEAYQTAMNDPEFKNEFQRHLSEYVGRPTSLYYAERLTKHVGGARIFMKREDLSHTGAHKINNSIGQAMLTVRMNKKRIIAETGAGQHGVATATAAAKFGLNCDVFMGTEDMRRQQPNVKRMQLLGANVVPVESGSCTLKDATNAAMRDWMGSSDSTHYIIGSVVGPHPFPQMVRDFQAVIGIECRAQCLDQIGRLPDIIIACVGGGSNAAGIFFPFIDDHDVKLLGVEAGGRSDQLGDHAAPLSFGGPGVLHGSRSYVLQNKDGQTSPVHSISAGLDYPGVGPEHAHWHKSGRASYTSCSDKDALEAFTMMCKIEGIIPALESSHAIAQGIKTARSMKPDQVVVINLSGRGDKDLEEALRLLDDMT